MLLRARFVLPIVQPPIENGAVLVRGNRVVAVGSWPQLAAQTREKATDLGEAILLPGLVNAHAHLDYTAMGGMLSPKNLPDWIKELVSLRADWSYKDFFKSWTEGATMLLRNGTTTVADIESVPELLPEVWAATPLRLFSFLEMTCVRNQRDPKEVLRATVAHARRLPRSGGGVGLSPHALYSTTPALLRHVAAEQQRGNWRLAMHVAESAEEREMYRYRGGSLFRWLAPQREMSDCGKVSPVERVNGYGLLNRNFLAIHANYLSGSDIQLLARAGASIVHCPRSHAFFGHRPFSWKRLSTAGVNVCLGTDSLGSIHRRAGRPELSLFEEMRLLSRTSGLSPGAILKLATVNGAHALGLSGRVGEISAGSYADLIALPFHGRKAAVKETVVNHIGGVQAVLVAGRWVLGRA